MPDNSKEPPPPLILDEWETNLIRRLRQLLKDGYDLITLSLALKTIISKHKGSGERLERMYRPE